MELIRQNVVESMALLTIKELPNFKMAINDIDFLNPLLFAYFNNKKQLKLDKDDLTEIISDGEINLGWKISKDRIDVCKNCEFRNICSDCRAFRIDQNDFLSKPLKCGYDPYKAQWKHWTELSENVQVFKKITLNT
ncbi:MAG: hypothetical protein DWP98_12335 [Bacteroidetes bacterium]|nr:MAG: hypothetical protein DWP98_12335 [Bacteroidota bacterium]MBL1145493.1 hypothetical protein [Bacteroidota bacterium]NOG58291.1 hypothetical protein [Bacteroidota bacterium]